MTTVLEVLRACGVVPGNIVKLPEIQLGPKLFGQVKKRLELIGGKWTGGKTQGFVFEEDPTELLAAVANGDDRNLKKEFQFFPTPADIAQQMVSYLPAIQDDYTILEPSAGAGAFLRALSAIGVKQKVDCYEIMDLNRMKLSKIDNANLIGEDFLLCDRVNYYDIIIANPPFTKNQDIDHIRKMFEVLKPGGTMITLCSPSWQLGTYRKHNEFRDWLESLDVFPLTLPQKSFVESGTMITPLLLQIKKPKEQVEIKDLSGKPTGNLDKEIVDAFKKGYEKIQAAEAAPVEEPAAEQETSLPKTQEIIKQMLETEKQITTDLQELQQMISPNNNDMNFFTELFPLLDGIDVTLRLKRRNGALTVDVLPSTGTTIRPATFSGTPEEMDTDFLKSVKLPIEKAKVFVIEMDQLHKSIEEAKTKATEEADKLKKDDAKKPAAPATEKAKTPEPKKDVVKKAEKKITKIEEPSLF